MSVVKLLFLPPNVFLVGCTLFLVFALGFKRLSRLFVGLSIACVLAFYACATPLLSSALMRVIQVWPKLDPDDAIMLAKQDGPPTAIVILSAGRESYAPQFGGQSVDALTLERLHYGSRLAKLTGFPVLVSGGNASRETGPSLALLMSRTLRQDFGIRVSWTEARSHNTWQNAQFSAEMLRRRGIRRVMLVTHGWHMPRAIYSFEQTGLEIIPAPTAIVPPHRGFSIDFFLPSMRSLTRTFYGFHEIIGGIWYRLAKRPIHTAS